MSQKVDRALERLIEVLPLKEKQEKAGEAVKALHRAVIRSFAEKGRILTLEEMNALTDDPDSAIDALKEGDMVVFDPEGKPIGAYPFTMEEREHKVLINGRRVHAMCALDALSVAPMFDCPAEVSSCCRVTGSPVLVKLDGMNVLNMEENRELRFGIVWGAACACSCCADSLCTEMMFLQGEKTAADWLAEDSDNREVFTLVEAVKFGARFFSPLLRD